MAQKHELVLLSSGIISGDCILVTCLGFTNILAGGLKKLRKMPARYSTSHTVLQFPILTTLKNGAEEVRVHLTGQAIRARNAPFVFRKTVHERTTGKKRNHGLFPVILS